MWTFTVNWHLLLGFVAFVLVTGIIQSIVSSALGVTERLKDLSGWKIVVHDAMYMVVGSLGYMLFFK